MNRGDSLDDCIDELRSVVEDVYDVEQVKFASHSCMSHFYM